MGGKALSKYGVETIRLSTPEFLELAKYFQNKVEKDLGVETHVVEFFREKQSHGDLDLLIKIDNPINIKEYIGNNIGTKALHNNGGVLSFEYNNFQVDFIPISNTIWESAKAFFDWDPTGNLMGKTAHKFGAKYGFDGLVLPIRNFNGRISKNIQISTNMRRVFEFLGYDYDRYLKGFDTKQEIFDWVINSKFFDSEMFEMQNLNQIDRKRNRKRATYQEFLEYLKSNNIKKSFNFKDKEEYLERIDEFFPEVGLQSEIEKLQKLDNKKQEVSKKFNGNIIMNRHNWLKGKELGDIMNRFKSNFKNFDEYILKNDTEKIMKDFDSFLDKP